MAKKLTKFEKLDGWDDIWCARGGTLRCTAMKLSDSSLCLFSPVQGLTQAGVDQLSDIGDVRFLLAPNHYHNKAIGEYTRAFPNARTIAPESAIERLTRVTGISFSNLDSLTPVLPRDASILVPDGLKTGEIWIRRKTEDRSVWIVVDAFCTQKKNAKEPVTDIPEVLGTFPKFGVSDAQVYQEWVQKQINIDHPTLIIPCHGSLIQSDELGLKLLAVMSSSFKI